MSSAEGAKMVRPLYPVFLDLHGRLVVVVGGGAVAERKVSDLLECEAEIRVVAPEVTGVLASLARQKRIEWLRREFHPGDIEGAFLAFAATDKPAVNTRVCHSSDVAGVPVNRVESPEASDFLVPAVLRRGGLAVAVSTGGASPHLTQLVRDAIAGQYGPEYADCVRLLERARAEVLRTVSDSALRRRVLRRLAEDAELLDALRREGREAAWDRARGILEAESSGAGQGE
jgi:precorrin-2 dehydrogenase/sirohydrochlorin ferrochelatase